MTTTSRDHLLKTASLVRPALSTQAFIPALQHIRFADGHATTFNDVMAMSVKAETGLEHCVPGETLIRALTSFNADQVSLKEDDNGNLLLASGRAKLKLPTLPVNKFPLEMPRGQADVVEVNEQILDAVRRCLFSVGTDPTHPAQMGVTLQTESGVLVAYSTDNFTISRATTKTKADLPGDAPIILPTAFCEQLLTLAKAFPDDDVDLHLYPAAIKATFGKKAWLLTKTMADLEPMDFGKIIGKHVKLDNIKAALAPIPEAFDSAWNRALLVLASEADKATRVAGGGSIELYSKSDTGEAVDELEFKGKLPQEDFYVDPTLVVRAAKSCGSLSFQKSVMVLATDDASFIHLIAHCSA